MRKVLSTIVASTFLVVMAGSPAVAAVDDSPIDAIATVAPQVLDAAADVTTQVNEPKAIDSVLEEINVSVPSDPIRGIDVVAGSTSVSIELPYAEMADDAAFVQDGVVSYDNNNSSFTVPVVREDGSVQISTVIESADAPTRFDYRIDVPLDAHLRLASDGSGAQIVDAAGEVLGSFAAPWALDALGSPVPTRYEVAGGVLTQVVVHGEGTVYPVVADPTYTTTTYYYSRAAVEEMWRAINNINNVCQYLPLSYWAGLGCGAPASLRDAVTQAHYQSKRIKAVYYNCGFNYCSYYKYSVVA